MGAERFILANPCIPRFLKGLTHSAMWHCMWANLVANLGTKASGETSRPNFEPMQIMVVQFATDASGSFGANWWPNLRLMQVAPYCCQVQSKLRSQFLGPLCLWQCFQDVPQNKLAKLRRHAGRVHFAKIQCGRSSISQRWGADLRPQCTLKIWIVVLKKY